MFSAGDCELDARGDRARADLAARLGRWMGAQHAAPLHGSNPNVLDGRLGWIR